MRNGLLGGEDLRRWRCDERPSQARAARWFGVCHQRISLWERIPALLPKDFHERFLAVIVRYYRMKDMAEGGPAR